MSHDNQSFDINRKDFTELSLTNRAWQSYLSKEDKDLGSFFLVSKICEEEIIDLHILEINFPKRFGDNTLWAISECLRIAEELIKNPNPPEELTKTLNYLDIFQKNLYYLLPTQDFKVDNRLIEKFMIFSESLKCIDSSDDKKMIIIRYLFQSSYLMFMITLMYREKNGKDKTLNLIFHFFQSLLTDLINEPRLQEISLTAYDLPTNICNIDMSSTDIIYYLLNLINQIAKLNPQFSMHYLVIQIVPKLIDFLLLIPKFKNIENSEESYLAVHKSFMVFSLLHTVTCINYKEELIESLLEDYAENIKELFFCTVANCVKHYWNSEFVERFLRIFYDIFPKNVIRPSLDFMPIEIFANLIRNVNDI